MEQLSRFLREDMHMSAQTPPIKVMQVIARMNVGGPAVIVAELMRGMDSSKYQQTLVTGYCADDEADYLETVATDIPAIRINALGRSVSLLKDLSSFFALVKLIRRLKPDVIHTHTAKAGVLGRLASLVAGGSAKRVHTFHGHLLHGYFNAPKRAIMIAMERILGWFTFRIIAIGNVVKNDLLDVGIGSAKKFLVFFPGLPEPKPTNRQEMRKVLGLAGDTLYCTFVGRLTYIKRPDRLLDVAVLLESRGVKVHFLVAGEGEQFESSKSRATHDQLPITFLGWRSDTDAILTASDIAILCSDNEGIPLTLIQAAQAGLPIVATNVGSISDIVVSGSNGLLTATNPEALAEAIEILANDSALRQSMGSEGQRRAREFFSLARMISDHSNLYSRCMQGND